MSKSPPLHGLPGGFGEEREEQRPRKPAFNGLKEKVQPLATGYSSTSPQPSILSRCRAGRVRCGTLGAASTPEAVASAGISFHVASAVPYRSAFSMSLQDLQGLRS